MRSRVISADSFKLFVIVDTPLPDLRCRWFLPRRERNGEKSAIPRALSASRRAAVASCSAALRFFRALRLAIRPRRSEEHTSELQSLMRNSYAVFCLKKKNNRIRYEKMT